MDVQNCEGSEILLPLQTYEIACHSFMGTGGGHKPPGAENRDSLLS